MSPFPGSHLSLFLKKKILITISGAVSHWTEWGRVKPSFTTRLPRGWECGGRLRWMFFSSQVSAAVKKANSILLRGFRGTRLGWLGQRFLKPKQKPNKTTLCFLCTAGLPGDLVLDSLGIKWVLFVSGCWCSRLTLTVQGALASPYSARCCPLQVHRQQGLVSPLA